MCPYDKGNKNKKSCLMSADVRRCVAPAHFFFLAEADGGYGNSSGADARPLRILPWRFPGTADGGNDRLLTTQGDADPAYLPRGCEREKAETCE